MKKLWVFVIIVLVGGVSGILASAFLVPYMAHTPPFDKVGWIKDGSGGGTTIINKTEEKIINQDTAMIDSINQVFNSVVGISAKTAVKKGAPENIFYGTGIIATGDGLVVAAGVPGKASEVSVFLGGQVFPAEISGSDADSGLVLLKISQTNLPVANFADFAGLNLGERVDLLAVDSSGKEIEKLVDWGIIKNVSSQSFLTNLDKEDEVFSGAPLITADREIAGLCLVEKDGSIKIITADQIKQFIAQ
jgi:S1-C subfamily serine protease